MRKLIYILGVANCGSTLLTKLLGAHSQVATVGELKAQKIADVNTYRCGCGTIIAQCQFWKAVQAACARKGLSINLADLGTHFERGTPLQRKIMHTPVRGPLFEALRNVALRTYPGLHPLMSRILETNATLMDAICEVQRKEVFLDGSKDPTRLIYFQQSRRFDLKAIHLVRDGRAVACSYKKKGITDFGYCIQSWKSKALECARASHAFASTELMCLRYEDLCQDVPGTLTSLTEFIGLPREEFGCGLDVEQHIIGHNMRLSTGRQISVREEWKELLSEQELAAFDAEGSQVNALYDYPATSNLPPSREGAAVRRNLLAG
jgi:hypothetical protein